MNMFRFLTLAVALTALLAGCAATWGPSPSASPSFEPATSDEPLIDRNGPANPTSVPGSLEAP